MTQFNDRQLGYRLRPTSRQHGSSYTADKEINKKYIFFHILWVAGQTFFWF